MAAFKKLNQFTVILLLMLIVTMCSSCALNKDESGSTGNGSAGSAANLELTGDGQQDGAAEDIKNTDGSTAAATEKAAITGKASTAGPAETSESVDAGNSEIPGNSDTPGDSAAPGNTEGPSGLDVSGQQEIGGLTKITAQISIQTEDGSSILPVTTVEVEEGDTVLSILLRVGKDQKIPVVFSGLKKSAYIQGIDNLFEFDKGSESGWIYKVNGNAPLKSCGAYPVAGGDEIEWIYVTSLGEALG